MATRAHVNVDISYTPKDTAWSSEDLAVWGIAAPALSRWDGDPHDLVTVEGLIREAFEKAMMKFRAEFPNRIERWQQEDATP